MVEVYAHPDADGLSSAYLYGLASEEEVEGPVFPEIFGKVNEDSSEVIMLDMRPTEDSADRVKVCYDHHPDHLKDRSYKLVTDEQPTVGIVLNEFRKSIPREQRWKAMIGYCGDGQPEKSPVWLWKENPELIERIQYVSRYRGEAKTFDMPIYRALSSGVNAACKVNRPREALTELARASSPLELIRNRKLLEFKSQKKTAIDGVFKDNQYSKALMINGVFYMTIDHEFKIASEIATILEDSLNVTAIVVNEDSGKFSLRGDLVPLVKEGLQERGVDCGGHAKFSGGFIEDTSELEDILRDIMRLDKS